MHMRQDRARKRGPRGCSDARERRIWPLRLIWDILSLAIIAWSTSNRSLGYWCREASAWTQEPTSQEKTCSSLNPEDKRTQIHATAASRLSHNTASWADNTPAGSSKPLSGTVQCTVHGITLTPHIAAGSQTRQLAAGVKSDPGPQRVLAMWLAMQV